jgi:hypothetical protein
MKLIAAAAAAPQSGLRRLLDESCGEQDDGDDRNPEGYGHHLPQATDDVSSHPFAPITSRNTIFLA